MEKQDYININKESWNKRTEIHFDSEFYDVDKFIKGKSSLNKFELDLLGDIKGKNLLHLQCHFGQDTISLNRLGAAVVGVDFSDKAIEKAKNLATLTDSSATFICCDIYDLKNHLDKKFDLIFSSYGVIGWLPDLGKWAELISRFLKPGGRFVFVEFHPVLWMFDDEFEKIKYNYFNENPIVETETGTYANKDADVKLEFVNWNHSIAEVVTSLIKNSLMIESFNEYDYSPYDCFKKSVQVDERKFRIKNFENKLPMVYSLSSVKAL